MWVRMRHRERLGDRDRGGVKWELSERKKIKKESEKE